MSEFYNHDQLDTIATQIGNRMKSASRYTVGHSGRVYLYAADDRWVTPYDDLYGPAYYQNAENGGTGTTPIIEWEHSGEMVKKGQIIHQLMLRGRVTDANAISDVELYAVYTRPDTEARLFNTGLDNDGEDIHTVLYQGLWRAGGGDESAHSGGVINDKYRRHIDLNFTVPEHGDLRLYFKPISVDPRPDTSNDYFYQAHKWEMSYPFN